MSVFLNAFLMVFFAEMGDKSQIMAMSFAAKYPLRKVSAGIALGVAANHGIAVGFGYFLGQMLPLNIIGILAGLLFLFFGLMAFKLDDEDDDAEKPMRFSVVTTIAIAFFIGEFGDKTQLTATALASEAINPFIVLGGTVTAMLATAAIGIAIGLLLGKNLPEMLIKVVSGFVFIFFGTQKLMATVPFLTTLPGLLLYALGVSALMYYFLKPTIVVWRSGALMPMQRMAEELKQIQGELHRCAQGLCRTEAVCGQCRGTVCIVGQTKALVAALEQDDDGQVSKAIAELDVTVDRHFNQKLAEEGLRTLNEYKNSHPEVMAHFAQRIAPIESRLELLSKQI